MVMAARAGNTWRARVSSIAILLLFAAALACLWRGPQATAVADGIAYITGGVHLARDGEYRNPFGEPETWFPPSYPLLIGFLSLGGRVDPFIVARWISMGFAVLSLWLVLHVGRRVDGRAGLLAMLVLAANPTFQEASSSTLSQSMATALSLAAFAVWLGLGNEKAPLSYVALGFLVGASHLTRPESILLLPAWALLDLCLRPRKIVLRGYVLAAATCLLTMSPYVLWLSAQTGRWSLTNKGEVNLAGGRADYYGTPREYIDPQTLEMGYYPNEVTASQELHRYGHNLTEIFKQYWLMCRAPLGLAVLLAAAAGIPVLWRQTRYRLLFGLGTHFLYLPILAWYTVSAQYLHATLPAFCLLAAFGANSILHSLGNVSGHRVSQVTAMAFVVWLGLGLAEMGSRLPRWALTMDADPATLLRDVGLQLKATRPPEGVVYEWGATAGYYAGQRRGRLTPNDLETLLKYIDKHESGRGPVWLALASFHSPAYHSSVRSLLDAPNGRFPRVAEIADERGRAVIYRLR
jgi:dolichyl-phosphate-mannose-protein mannosyltransferase